jgi:hypothetical protein
VPHEIDYDHDYDNDNETTLLICKHFAPSSKPGPKTVAVG